MLKNFKVWSFREHLTRSSQALLWGPLCERPVITSSISLDWTAAALAEDQDSSWPRSASDGLLSEQWIWQPFSAPVDQLLGSDSDTSLACCETLTTLICNWHQILYSRLQSGTLGMGSLGINMPAGGVKGLLEAKEKPLKAVLLELFLTCHNPSPPSPFNLS